MTRESKYQAIRDYGSIKGWLSPKEARSLFDLSASIRTNAPVIVEIGSWMGQSSVILAKGIRNNPKGKVYCIDPFDIEGSSITKEMKDQAYEVESQASNLLDVFLTNVKHAGVAERIEILRGYSYQFVPFWNKPIDLLFIDADHSYDAVRRDFTDWSGFVRQGGWIVLHDVELPSHQAHYFEGPGKVVEELIVGNPDFEQCQLIDYIFCARKPLK